MIQFFVQGNPQEALNRIVKSSIYENINEKWGESPKIFGVTFYRGEIGQIWHKITVEPLAQSPKNRFHTLVQAFETDEESIITFLEKIEEEIKSLLIALLKE